MKKVIVSRVIVLTVILSACGGKESTTTSVDASATPAAVNDVTKTPEYKDGLALVEKSDCKTCHKLDVRSTGPGYIEIANKYEDNEKNHNLLAEKIMKGGKGVWGETPMLAHLDIKKEDAIKIVKYILSTKKL